MKTFWVTLSAILLLLGLLFWENAWTAAQTSAMRDNVLKMETLLQKDPQEAKESYAAYASQCQRTIHQMLFFAHHSDLMEIKRLNARLGAYLMQENAQEAMVAIEEIKTVLEALEGKETFSLRNLF